MKRIKEQSGKEPKRSKKELQTATVGIKREPSQKKLKPAKKAKEGQLQLPDTGSEKDDDAKDKEIAAAIQGGKWDYLDRNVYTATGRLAYVDPRSLPIREWQPSEIPLDSFVIEYGKRRTGKSYFTRYLFYLLKGLFWHVMVLTKTKSNGFFQKFMEADHVIKGFKPVALANLAKIQEQLIEAKNEGEIPENTVTNALVWLDDVAGDKTLRTDEDLKETAMMGRHRDQMVGINTQHPTVIPPDIRSNADIVVIFTQINLTQRLRLVQEYLSMFNTRTAMELMDMYTVDHGCLVLELWRNDPDPLNMVYWFKAQDPGNFRVERPIPPEVEEEIEKMDRNENDDDYDAYHFESLID
jgi:hypothetical protein